MERDLYQLAHYVIDPGARVQQGENWPHTCVGK